MKTWILQRYQVYGRVLLIAGVMLAPVVWSRETQDVFNLLKLMVILVTGLAAAAVTIAWSAERRVWPPKFRLLIPMGAFLFACLIATIFSQNPTLSLFGLYHRYGGLLPFLLYALVALALVALYWERPVDLREIAKASAAGSLLLVLYVLIQEAGQDWIPWKDSSGGPPPYPVGTMGNSNFAGAYLGIALPFVLYLAYTARKDWHRMALWLFAALDVLALWFTQTRGGMIAAGAGVLAMLLAERQRVPKWGKITVAVGTAIAAVMAVLILWHPGSDKPPGPLARVEAFRTESFDFRTYYWSTAWRIFADHPVIGVGLEQYYANYPTYRLPEDGARLGLTITDKPHNIFLEYMANAGLLGFLSYAALVLMAMKFGLSRRSELDEKQRLLLTAFTGVLAGYLAQGVFSIDVPPLAVMGWIAIGGIAAIGDPVIIAERAKQLAASRGKGKPGKGKRGPKRAQVSAGPTRWAIHAPTGVVLIALLALGIRPLMADAVAKDGADAGRGEGGAKAAEATFKRAIKLYPVEASYYSQAGGALEAAAGKAEVPAQKQELLQQALGHYRNAVQRQPGNVFFLMSVARVLTTQAESGDAKVFPKAETAWKRAVDHDPTDWQVRNSYALMLNSYANARGGDKELRRVSLGELLRVAKIKPDFLDVWLNITKVYRVLGEQDKAAEALRTAAKLAPENEEVIKLRQEFGI